jgi:hypothetical protein
MGVRVRVRLKDPIADVDPLHSDGKLLAKAMDTLDGASRKLEIRLLSDFYSVSKKQALADLEGEDLTDEEWEALADDHVWWPPAEGLAAVERLLQWVATNPHRLHRPEDVGADLRDFRLVLQAAVRDGVQFNIAVSA